METTWLACRTSMARTARCLVPPKGRPARSPDLQRAQDPNIHAKPLTPARHPARVREPGRTFKTFQPPFSVLQRSPAA